MAIQNPMAPAGIAATADQMEARRRAAERAAMAATLNKTAGQIGSFATGVMGALDAGAAGAPNFIANTTFDSSLPGQRDRDAQRSAASQAQATQYVANNPAQAQAAQGWADGVASDAVVAGLTPFNAAAPAPQTVASTSPTAQVAPVQAPPAAPQTPWGIDRKVTSAYEPAQRGEYNMRQAPVAGPASSGIDMGFSSGFSPQDLGSQLRQQDQDRQRSRLERLLEAEVRWGSNSSSTIGEIAASRQRVSGLSALLGGRDAATAADQNNVTDLQKTGITAHQALQSSLAAGQATRDAATTAGEASMQGQRMAAMARIEAAQAGNEGSTAKSYAEASALARRVEAGDYYASIGDMESATAAYAGYNPAETPQLVQGLAGDVGTVTSRGVTPFTQVQMEALYGKPKK